MDNKQRCQSCGMPLGIGFYGTIANGSPSQEYCKLCFENGEFREPNLTLEDMMGRSAAHMIDELHMERVQAEELAQSVIPKLGRWANQTTDN